MHAIITQTLNAGNVLKKRMVQIILCITLMVIVNWQLLHAQGKRQNLSTDMQMCYTNIVCKYTYLIDAYLSLNGTVYANNSDIVISDIGEFDSSLQCIINYHYAYGVWYFPDGTEVPHYERTGFYATVEYHWFSQHQTIISLNRNSNVMLPIGQFCCETYTYSFETLCINVGEL